MSVADPAPGADAPLPAPPLTLPAAAPPAAAQALPGPVRAAKRVWASLIGQLAVDSLAISAAFYVSWYTRYVAEIGPEIEEFNYVPYVIYFPLQLALIPILIITFHFAGLYRARRGIEWFDDIPVIIRSTALGVMVLFTAVALLRYPASSRLTFILVWFFSAVLVTSGRAWMQVVLAGLHRRGLGVERVLIVGGNNLGRMIMQSLASRMHLGYRVVGFLDDDRLDDFGRFRHLGGLDDIGRVAEAERIEQVIVALPSASHAAILKIVDHCRRDGVRFKIVPDLYEMSLSQVDVDTVGGIPLIGLKDVSIQGGNAVTKRVVDVVLSATALLVCAPLLGLIAALIRLESSGSVVFRQLRIGKNGEPFTINKFRSMTQGAGRLRDVLLDTQEGDARLFKDPVDPRRTRVGAIIRRWSLDELPQFWNVLRGDMSIVGPRPQIPEEVANYEDWHYKRLAVSPGLTGLWQVNGRSELSFDEMVIYDIYYIENWSLGLDFRILLRTLPAVLRGRGAF